MTTVGQLPPVVTTGEGDLYPVQQPDGVLRAATPGQIQTAAGALIAANDLADVGSTQAARNNLGLGGAAVLAVGTGLGISGGNLVADFGTTPGTVADGAALAAAAGVAASAQATAGQAATAAGAALGGVQTVASATITSGQSITIPNGCNVFVLNGTGTLNSLTVTMPALPLANQNLTIISNVSIVLFSLLPNAGQTLLSAPSNAPVAIGGSIEYQFSGAAWV